MRTMQITRWRVEILVDCITTTDATRFATATIAAAAKINSMVLFDPSAVLSGSLGMADGEAPTAPSS